ncbi:MAG: hypothetical protein HPY59_09070 [Anaerolineae bacterium]|nr:hypothetical protein [Anaerolineae bacterium]
MNTTKKNWLLSTVVFLFFSISCSAVQVLLPTRQITEPPSSSESGQSAPPTLAAISSTPETAELSASQSSVLNIGIMIHLEGWRDDKEREAYVKHTTLVRRYADLFEKYGAKMTFETIDVAKGDLKFGGGFLSEMRQRGHGVGLHADVGGDLKYKCERFTPTLLEMKQVFDQLGISIIHTSGVTSKCDWVKASSQAGFKMVTGNVAFSLLSLSPDLIPEAYKNCQTPTQCHEPWPEELEKQIHPWRAQSGSNWIIPNPDGQVVILPESGGLPHLAEQLEDPHAKYTSDTFTKEDIDAYFILLDQALSLADPGRVNNFYVSWSIGQSLDEALLENWLSRLQTYVQSGRVRWMTLPEMYEEFISWEKK